MDHQFKDGQEVKAITYPDDSTVATGQIEVTKITVVMEAGQMAKVPWFAVWKGDKITGKHNGVHLACVTL